MRDGAPSAEEAKREHRSWLRDKGCQEDGCDVDDPDELQMCEPSYTHSCSVIQTENRPRPFCDEHVPDTSLESHIEYMKEEHEMLNGESETASHVILLVYECGAVTTASDPETPTIEYTHQFVNDDGDVEYEVEEREDPRATDFVRVPVKHRCGSELKETVVLDGWQE
jgi:hypothetical protein